MKIFISQCLALDLVNINVYAKVYQNIPFSSKDRAIFTFSEFEPRQRLGKSQNRMFDYRAHYESQPSVSIDFLRVVQYLSR